MSRLIPILERHKKRLEVRIAFLGSDFNKSVIKDAELNSLSAQKD